jgi:hypothetical protein
MPPPSPRAGETDRKAEQPMNKPIMSNFSIATLLIFSGCGAGVDVVSTTETRGPMDTQAAIAAAEADVTPPTLMSISGFVHAQDGTPLAEVRACLQAGPTIDMDIGECATSGPDGSWTIHRVPANMLVTVGFSKQGFIPALRAIQTGDADVSIPEDEGRLLRESDPPTFAGAPLDARTGGIEFFIGSENGSEIRASVYVFSFDDGPRDPVYTGADGNPMTGATSGSSGAVTNLPAGTYVLTFTAENASCTARGALYGYPYDAYHLPGSVSIIVPVADGYITSPVGVDCAGSAAPVGSAP